MTQPARERADDRGMRYVPLVLVLSAIAGVVCGAWLALG